MNRLRIEDAIDGNIQGYFTGLIPYAAPGVLLLLAAPTVAMIWCCCRCRCCSQCKSSTTSHEDNRSNQLRIGGLLLVVAAVIASVVFGFGMDSSANGIIADAHAVVDSVLERIDFVNASESRMRHLGFNLGVNQYLDSNAILPGMTLAFEADLLALNATADVFPDIASSIEAINQAAQTARTMLTLGNRTDLVDAMDDALLKLTDVRNTIAEQRDQALMRTIEYYISVATLPAFLVLPLLVLFLVSMTAFSCKQGGFMWSLGQFATPFLMILSILGLILVPLSVVLEDGCDYAEQNASKFLDPLSNNTAQRIAYACLYNHNLLTALEVNVTSILDLAPWTTFTQQLPVLNSTAATPFNATTHAMQMGVALLLGTPALLVPLFEEVRTLSDNAVCGSIGSSVFQFRDRLCGLPEQMYGAGVAMLLVVLAALISVSLRACKPKSGYHELKEESGVELYSNE